LEVVAEVQATFEQWATLRRLTEFPEYAIRPRPSAPTVTDVKKLQAEQVSIVLVAAEVHAMSEQCATFRSCRFE
jgi:hypothetical protein